MDDRTTQDYVAGIENLFHFLKTGVRTILKIFLIWTDLFRRIVRSHEGRTAYRRDPLSHPEIAAMSERQKGDLPFDACTILPD